MVRHTYPNLKKKTDLEDLALNAQVLTSNVPGGTLATSL